MSKKTTNKSTKRKTAATNKPVSSPKIHAFGDPALMRGIYGQVQLKPASGFSYQAFCANRIYTSVLSPKGAEYFLNQAMKGVKLKHFQILHFSDSHAEIFQKIVANNGLVIGNIPLVAYALFALEHFLSDNLAICTSLVTMEINIGFSKNDFQLLYPKLKIACMATDHQIEKFDEVVATVWHQFERDRLNALLPTKSSGPDLVKI